MTRAIPLPKTTVKYIASVFLDIWVMKFGIPSYLLTDNGPQLIAMLFSSVSTYLGVNKLTTMAYHPQRNEHTERYSKTPVAMMLHYAAEH